MNLENFHVIKQGAEAKLYTGTYLGKKVIVKERFLKKYRHIDLDRMLTKERIKAECKAIVKCKALGIKTPAIYLADLNRRSIVMEYFENSITVKEFILKAEIDAVEKLSEYIGKQLAKMHAGNIVHGDLTTSNMLLVNKAGCNSFHQITELELVFIDFGLAHTESSAEDKGVDLYVLERALLSTHEIAKHIFPIILESYQKQYNCKEVLNKYEEIRARGRKRTMVG